MKVIMSHPEMDDIELEGKDCDEFKIGDLDVSEVVITLTDVNGKQKVIRKLMSDNQYKKMIDELGGG